MGWGWRSKYKTSSYSSEFEFSFLFIKYILILLAKCDSGELRCPVTALHIAFGPPPVLNNAISYEPCMAGFWYLERYLSQGLETLSADR